MALLGTIYINDEPVSDTNPLPVNAQVSVGDVTLSGDLALADGADVTQGTVADAAVVADANGSISGKLRGLVKHAYERMPASLGQKTKAASLPVTLASDQDALPVTGTFWPATQPVSGTVAVSNLPGTQPISGTVGVINFPSSQAVTTIDGGQATIGTTTDASSALTVVGLLKAIKAAVQGVVGTKALMTASASGDTNASTTAAQLRGANAARAQLIVYNNDATAIVYIGPDSAVSATANGHRGLAIPPKSERIFLPTVACYFVADSGTPNVSWQDDSY